MGIMDMDELAIEHSHLEFQQEMKGAVDQATVIPNIRKVEDKSTMILQMGLLKEITMERLPVLLMWQL